ncbi:vWA domain-containing protein [Methylophilus sp.]|uniref:vWA domain-containing protein n=1 Tax=Methylophilus sp. TaxID=29541 RepID=UPI0040374DEB
MNIWLRRFIKHRDSVLLGLALLFLLGAILRPSIPFKHNIYTYFLVADISQSMNTKDMVIRGQKVTRLAYMQNMMHEVVGSLPCGTKVSIGLFAGNSVAAMYSPIEICQNFAAIQDTIDHLDWRMAWSGNSRLRESLFVTAKVVRGLSEPAQVVYFTDGEEAPKLHAFNTKNLEEFQGGDDWIFVGIGSEEGDAIPKLSEDNQVIGYWSNESFAMQPGIAQISESTLGVRDDNVAGDNDRYISKMAAEYMQSLTQEIGAKYIKGDSSYSVLQAMRAQKPARRDIAPLPLGWLLATLAGLCIVGTYASRHPLRQIKQNLKIYHHEIRSRLFNRSEAVAHDNHFQ